MESHSITFETTTSACMVNFNATELAHYPQFVIWWTQRMLNEPHLLKLSGGELLSSIESATFAFDDQATPIGAAGLFKARSKGGDQLFLDKFRIVEIGSSYVDPTHRNRGIGRELMGKCLESVKKQDDVLAVGVSTNKIVHHIFRSLGGSIMGTGRLAELRRALCLCDPVDPSCSFCPMSDYSNGWIFFHNSNQEDHYVHYGF